MKKNDKVMQNEKPVIKFRTLYDNDGYTFMEKGGGEDMTDASEYIPTDKLIARFMSGNIAGIGGSAEPAYDFNSNLSDDNAVHSEFAHGEAQEEFREVVSNLGAEGLRRLQVDTVSKIQKSRKKAQKTQETALPPAKTVEDGRGGNAQAGQTGATDKPSQRTA